MMEDADFFSEISGIYRSSSRKEIGLTEEEFGVLLEDYEIKDYDILQHVDLSEEFLLEKVLPNMDLVSRNRNIGTEDGYRPWRMLAEYGNLSSDGARKVVEYLDTLEGGEQTASFFVREFCENSKKATEEFVMEFVIDRESARVSLDAIDDILQKGNAQLSENFFRYCISLMNEVCLSSICRYYYFSEDFFFENADRLSPFITIMIRNNSKLRSWLGKGSRSDRMEAWLKLNNVEVEGL
jgi:hypothetical protein